MSRRAPPSKREVLPDPNSAISCVTKFMNCLMYEGKKSVAERHRLWRASSASPSARARIRCAIFHDALGNVKPAVEVRSRRVGGATYQVPVEVRPDRGQALAIRWLISYARATAPSTTMEERLSGELLDAANNRGNAVKKREDTHRMADANKAFSHYRW